MSDVDQLNKIVSDMKPLDFTEFIGAMNQLGEAAARASALFQARLDETVANIIKIAEALPPETYHAIGMKHPREVLLNEVEPAEVVQYILQQPDHTWMGVTIYPDEAWRYEHKSDWMWWRK